MRLRGRHDGKTRTPPPFREEDSLVPVCCGAGFPGIFGGEDEILREADEPLKLVCRTGSRLSRAVIPVPDRDIFAIAHPFS